MHSLRGPKCAVLVMILGLSLLTSGDGKTAESRTKSEDNMLLRTTNKAKTPAYQSLDDGRIPISQPTTIVESGHYILTKDITSLSGSVIDIGPGNVTLDLNGHTLTTAAPFSTIRFVTGLGVDGRVSIRNGRLRGGGIEMQFFTNPRTVKLEDLEVSNGHIDIQYHDGLFLPIIDIENCSLINGSIAAWSDPGGMTARLVNNIIQDGGIYVRNSVNSVVAGNSVRNGGIMISGAWGGNLVKENSVAGKEFGIFVTPYDGNDTFSRNNAVIGNVVRSSGTGISVSTSYTRVEGNVTSENSGDGIVVTDSARDNTVNVHLENNQSNGNGGCGIRLWSEGGHTFRGNNVRGNGISGIAGECGGDLGTNLDAGGNIL